MAQQLNLHHARFGPQRQHFTARQGLALMVIALGAAVLLSQLLQWQSRVAGREAQAVEAGNQPLREQLLARAKQPGTGADDSQAELAQLQTLDVSQRRIRAALDAGLAGSREGHADYLVALARQATGQLWITGFTVTEGGAALVLEGRMADADALTDYLRRLNAEPRFRGRPFAQLTLQAVTGPGGHHAYTEFTLRAAAAQAVDPAIAARAAADTLALAAAASAPFTAAAIPTPAATATAPIDAAAPAAVSTTVAGANATAKVTANATEVRR